MDNCARARAGKWVSIITIALYVTFINNRIIIYQGTKLNA